MLGCSSLRRPTSLIERISKDCWLQKREDIDQWRAIICSLMTGMWCQFGASLCCLVLFSKLCCSNCKWSWIGDYIPFNFQRTTIHVPDAYFFRACVDIIDSELPAKHWLLQLLVIADGAHHVDRHVQDQKPGSGAGSQETDGNHPPAALETLTTLLLSLTCT